MVSMFAAIAAVSAFAEPMLTEWGAKVTSANALREYPRPQLERSNWTCLNGDWDYAVTPVVNAPVRPDKWDGKIRVPFALESPLSGCNGRLLNPQEYLWYARKVVLDPKPGERILLHFGAVDFRAMVFLGHDEVAATPHDGGQLPFVVDLTPDERRIGELLRGVFGERYLGGRLPTGEGLRRFAEANPSILKPEPLPIYLNPAVR